MIEETETLPLTTTRTCANCGATEDSSIFTIPQDWVILRITPITTIVDTSTRRLICGTCLGWVNQGLATAREINDGMTKYAQAVTDGKMDRLPTPPLNRVKFKKETD